MGMTFLRQQVTGTPVEPVFWACPVCGFHVRVDDAPQVTCSCTGSLWGIPMHEVAHCDGYLLRVVPGWDVPQPVIRPARALQSEV